MGKSPELFYGLCVCCVGELEKWAGRDSRLPVEDLDGYLRMNGLSSGSFFYRESCSQARQNKGIAPNIELPE